MQKVECVDFESICLKLKRIISNFFMQKNGFHPLGVPAYKRAVSANPVLIQAADFNWRMGNPSDKTMCLEFSDPWMDQRFSAAWPQLCWRRLNT
ncbi:hypothetical protein [Polaromonas sp. DSR2-3-2]|uniref:hypothetical protein n=1 Tax=unclassified Polaromonas TaxID=2638319 RepID=UPI003CEB4675